MEEMKKVKVSYCEVEISHINEHEIEAYDPGATTNPELLDEKYAGKFRAFVENGDGSHMLEDDHRQVRLFNSVIEALNFFGNDGWDIVTIGRYDTRIEELSPYVKVLFSRFN